MEGARERQEKSRVGEAALTVRLTAIERQLHESERELDTINWEKATLEGKPVRHAWRLWEYAWRTPEKGGPATVTARATDTKGRAQPLKRDPDRRNYLVTHVLPVEVRVE